MKKPEKAVVQNLGFPPFWAPSEKKNDAGHHGEFHARVIAFDNRDPKMNRWVFQLIEDTLVCGQGDAEHRVEIEVNPGDFFTTSDYAAFMTLDDFLGLDVYITALSKERMATDARKTMWKWELVTSPEVDAIVRKRRENKRRQLAANGQPAPKQMAQNAEYVDDLPVG